MLSVLRQYKLAATLFGCLGLISALGLIDTFTHIVGGVLLPTGFMSLVGLASLVLVSRSLQSDLRFISWRPYIELIGGVLLGLGLVNFLFPRFFGLLYYNLRPADLSVFFFGGIGMLLLALEHLPDQKRPLTGAQPFARPRRPLHKS